MTRKFDFEMPKSLTEIVASRLRLAIIDGEFALGEMISEENLAASFGVSRTPVRDALTLLQTTGLVEVRPKRGSFVFKPSEADLIAICDFRLTLEVRAAQRSFERDREATLAGLEACFDELAAAHEAEDDVRYGHADLAFHRAFFTHSGNPYLSDAYDLVAGRVGALRTAMSRQFSDARDTSLTEHRAVIGLIAAGDFEGLHALLKLHIERTIDAYVLAFGPDDQQPAPRKRLQRIT